MKGTGRPKGGKNKKWSTEEKLRIVKRYLEDVHSSREVATEEGIDAGMLRKWARRYQSEGESGLVNKKKTGNPYSALHTSKSLNEVEKLRLLTAKQQIEIARLKKGYWIERSGAKKEFVTLSVANIKLSKK